MLEKILHFLKSKSKGEYSSPQSLKRQRVVQIGLAVVAVVLSGFMVVMVKGSSPQARKEKPGKVIEIATGLDAVDEREIWTHRLEKRAEKAEKEALEAKNKNKALEKKVDVLEDLFKKLGEREAEKQETLAISEASQPLKTVKSSAFPSQETLGRETSFPPKSFRASQDAFERGQRPQGERFQPPLPQILHLSIKGKAPQKPKTVDHYIPLGTHVRAVLLSGVVASTAIQAQSNPQPVILRLMEGGTMPRGFKGDLKDAVLIGSCYGDISSERAFCRIHKLSLTERNGEILEKSVEGWILGEDGRQGLKGDVIDRAGDVARNAMAAGILGGMAKFFENQASSSVFPVSPFGQTNALKGKSLVTGGMANGASNALEKLAEFSIKRAEQMQPVILVASGRMVDVVFKEGIDLSESTVKQELQRLGEAERVHQATQEARLQPVQLSHE